MCAFPLSDRGRRSGPSFRSSRRDHGGPVGQVDSRWTPGSPPATSVARGRMSDIGRGSLVMLPPRVVPATGRRSSHQDRPPARPSGPRGESDATVRLARCHPATRRKTRADGARSVPEVRCGSARPRSRRRHEGSPARPVDRWWRAPLRCLRRRPGDPRVGLTPREAHGSRRRQRPVARRPRSPPPYARATLRPRHDPLLDAKLAIPVRRSGTVRRTRLLRELRSAATRPVISIVAPPGYGKTSLLANGRSRIRGPSRG